MSQKSESEKQADRLRKILDDPRSKYLSEIDKAALSAAKQLSQNSNEVNRAVKALSERIAFEKLELRNVAAAGIYELSRRAVADHAKIVDSIASQHAADVISQMEIFFKTNCFIDRNSILRGQAEVLKQYSAEVFSGYAETAAIALQNLTEIARPIGNLNDLIAQNRVTDIDIKDYLQPTPELPKPQPHKVEVVNFAQEKIDTILQIVDEAENEYGDENKITFKVTEGGREVVVTDIEPHDRYYIFVKGYDGENLLQLLIPYEQIKVLLVITPLFGGEYKVQTIH